MLIGVTGATGFLGRYIARKLVGAGHQCRCWARPQSDRTGFEGLEKGIEWIDGDLASKASNAPLVRGADAIVHAALYRPGAGFRGAEGDVPTFVERNVLGTIRLMAAAREAGVKRFVFISTCAVHEIILDDRHLDEAHPLWPTSHYGAHKAAIEKFVHSYGLSDGWDVCALRPTGIYGVAQPITKSKWFDLVGRVKRGEPIASDKGGKEVHADDVAQAVSVLLQADGVAGQAYNCYDMYVADQDVAHIAKELTDSESEIEELNHGPLNEIETKKLRALGVEFGGAVLLEQTIGELVEAV